eukprot:15448568-Alexandrium_andersonii.AAC.1
MCTAPPGIARPQLRPIPSPWEALTTTVEAAPVASPTNLAANSLTRSAGSDMLVSPSLISRRQFVVEFVSERQHGIA